MAHAPQDSHTYDPRAPLLSIPEWDNPLNAARTQSIEREETAVSPPEFSPNMEGRLFTALDATITSDCKIHPTASLLYDDLPQALRDTFEKCPMYLEKHLDYVNYLLLHSPSEIDKTTEAAERERLKRLGIQIPTGDGDNKKWQCSVVGCKYKGTLQHLVSHLRTKAHLGIRMFACSLGCKQLFHHAHDRDRHEKGKTCIRSGQVKEAAESQGSRHSLRGSQEQSTSMPKGKVKPKMSHRLVGQRGHQNHAQTYSQDAEDLRARKSVYPDPRSQASVSYDNFNRNIPSTSSVPPFLHVPVHQTVAYRHLQSPNVPTSQQGYTGVHPAYDALQSPELFPAMHFLPTNNGGMHANSITNNHYIHSPAGNFANNPPAASSFLPGATYAQPHPVPHPAQPDSSAANQYPSQASGGRVQRLQRPQPYMEQDLGDHPRYHEGRGRGLTRPRTSMSSGRTPVNPPDPATTIRDPGQFYAPQTSYFYQSYP